MIRSAVYLRVSAVAIHKARKLANGYRSSIPPHRLFLFHKNNKLSVASERIKFIYQQLSITERKLYNWLNCN